MSINPFETITEKLEHLESKLDALHKLIKPTPTEILEALPQLGGIELAVLITNYKKSTIYKLVSAKKIPFSKPGGKLIFKTEDLLNWIGKNKLLN
ncbi:MAG TPA: helix-turn-helix domain-containing protein [Panacibacter sp.]|nr:helix-turn-helix domain-containing protein [Panacibacter sp.]